MRDDDLIGRLREHGRRTPSEAAALDAVRAEAAWPAELGARLLARAKVAIGSARRPTAWTTVRLQIRAIGDQLEALVGGRVVDPVAIRGDAPGGVLLTHAFGAGQASTHIDVSGDRFVVILDLGADVADRGLRVSLSRDGRELASEVLRKGRWLMPELRAGSYEVRAADRHGQVGELDLVLERPAG